MTVADQLVAWSTAEWSRTQQRRAKAHLGEHKCREAWCNPEGVRLWISDMVAEECDALSRLRRLEYREAVKAARAAQPLLMAHGDACKCPKCYFGESA
jgi:hypothetical protein